MDNEMLAMILDSPASDLAHYGVVGMKHGVRKYQNEDGTWTAAGKERRRTGGGAVSRGAKRVATALKKKVSQIKANHKKNSQIRSEKRAAAKAEKAARKAATTETNFNYKKATDEELQKAINRLRMEQTYRDMLASEKKPSKFKEAAKNAAINAFTKGGERLLTNAIDNVISTADAKRKAKKDEADKRLQEIEDARLTDRYNKWNESRDLDSLKVSDLEKFIKIDENRAKLAVPNKDEATEQKKREKEAADEQKKRERNAELTEKYRSWSKNRKLSDVSIDDLDDFVRIDRAMENLRHPGNSKNAVTLPKSKKVKWAKR